MPARVAAARVPKGRVPARRMAAATMLGFSVCNEKDRKHQKRAGHESTQKLRRDKRHLLSP